MRLLINVDGGSRGNPGPAGAGVTVRDEADRCLYEAGFFLGRMTNNQAEYHGLLKALEFVARSRAAEVCIQADSELLVRQINGDYRVRNAKLIDLYETAMAGLCSIGKWSVQHVRREFNARADELANLAMDRGEDVILRDASTPPATSPASSRSGRAGKAPTATKPATTALRHGPSGATKPAGRILVRCVRSPADGVCPAACRRGTEFVFEAVMPAGVCLSVAGELLAAVQAAAGGRGHPGEVGCTTPGCGARFTIESLPSWQP